MSELVRFGVSLDQELLTRFDQLSARKGYTNRSEALRDIIRRTLVDDYYANNSGKITGVLSLVYDHHHHDVTRQLVKRQHDAHECIITTVHVHMDHDNCLEILVLQGEAKVVMNLADSLQAVKGVKHGTFSISSSGSDIV